MKTKIVVIGGGGQGKVIINTLKRLDNYDILGYTDLTDKGLVLGTSYLGNDNNLQEIIKEYRNCKAVIGIGSVKISDKRENIYKMLKDIGFDLPVIISKDAIINEEVFLDEGTVIFDRAIVKVGSNIGKCAIINTGAIIEHDCKINDFVHVASGAIVSGGVEVGQNSIIGVGSKIIQYKKICENCLIGAGSVVIKDIDIDGTYLGVPVKRLN